MKTKLLTILAITLSCNLFAQKTIKYNTIFNNPKESNNLTFSTILIGSEQDGAVTIDFPIGLQLNYTTKRYALEARADFSLAGYLMHDSMKHGIKRFHDYIEINGAIFFSSKLKTKNTKVVLEESSRYVGATEYRQTKFIMVPVEMYRLIGLRGGVFNQGTFVTLRHDNKTKSYHNAATYGLFAGIFSKKFPQFKVEIDNSNKKKKTKRFVDFYFDVMLGTVNTIDPEYSGVTYNVDEVEKINIGGRLGWQWTSTRAFGLTGRFELGARPGVINSSSGFYVMMGLGFAISQKVGGLD